ncbi:LrgB family protein [Thalassotalea nanhaiensis]|uniref:LrgB family protein n=1 Tax=Thalassotalea nanhaiensis TaxID=3065648 RepID=A0ABY9THS5_9GAMM|nr:LrgB family protein [Colwelliaceae bacterium SQ345]
MTFNEKLSAIWLMIQGSPLTGIILTLLAYMLAMYLYKKSNYKPILSPFITCMIVVISVLLITGISYEDYFAGGKFIHFLLGPATVALAVPLYHQLHRIKQLLIPILITLIASVFIGSLSAIGIADLFGASLATQISLAPKSVTTPVAMGISEQIGGIVSLSAGLAATTGVLGGVIGLKIFSLVGVKDDRFRGFAMGLTSHGLGTAVAFKESNTMGAFSGLGMALASFTTAFMLPWILGMLAIN